MSSSFPPPLREWVASESPERDARSGLRSYLVLGVALAIPVGYALWVSSADQPPRTSATQVELDHHFKDLPTKDEPSALTADELRTSAPPAAEVPFSFGARSQPPQPPFEPPADSARSAPPPEPELVGPAANADGAHVVQTASFRLRERAEAAAAKLRDAGHEARCRAVKASDGSSWWTVRIGPFELRGEADIYRHRLALDSNIQPEVLPRARGPHYVQVGSFRTAERAERVARRLRRRRHLVHQRALEGKDGTRWHFVRIGPFDDRDGAEVYRGYVQVLESIEAVVVPFL